MNIICSQNGLVDSTRPKQRIADISADFSEISIIFGAFYYAEETDNNKINFEKVNKLISGYVSVCKKNNVKISLAYAPGFRKDDTLDFYKSMQIQS